MRYCKPAEVAPIAYVAQITLQQRTITNVSKSENVSEHERTRIVNNVEPIQANGAYRKQSPFVG